MAGTAWIRRRRRRERSQRLLASTPSSRDEVLALFIEVQFGPPGLAMVYAEGGSKERSFFTQNERDRAGGGDLDSLVFVIFGLPPFDVRIEHSPNGGTRLYEAALQNWCSAIDWLIQQGADVHLGRPSQGMTPLHAAALNGRSDGALLLLDAGARVDDCTQYGLTALHFAAATNELKMCKLLLSRCLLYTSPSPRDGLLSRMPSSA